MPRRKVSWRNDGVSNFTVRRPRKKVAAIPASASAATRRSARRGRDIATPFAAAAAAAGVDPDSAWRSNARSCAEWKRSSGFFSRQWRTTRSRPGATFLFVAERSGGSSRRIADMVSAAVSRWNARDPDSISYSTAPNAKMSERASADFPLTCSGAM